MSYVLFVLYVLIDLLLLPWPVKILDFLSQLIIQFHLVLRSGGHLKELPILIVLGEEHDDYWSFTSNERRPFCQTFAIFGAGKNFVRILRFVLRE